MAVQRIGDYVREQDRKLRELQQNDPGGGRQQEFQSAQPHSVRIAEELLDRIVVQRSRALCKQIEHQTGSEVRLLFRPDAVAPETLYYADEYDGIEDVLRRFLPLFDRRNGSCDAPEGSLSLKVYMWYDVREGLKNADETSSVVGLQRILVLKRLESSPVSFLITLLRLAVLHAHRINQLSELCVSAGDASRRGALAAAVSDSPCRSTGAVRSRKSAFWRPASRPAMLRTRLFEALSGGLRELETGGRYR